MKVVRPEWIVESVASGSLLPWRNYLYVHEERMEESQGGKSMQASLSMPVARESQSSHTPNPDTTFLSTKKTPLAIEPLYTTDPVTKADAARVPGYAADKSNPNAQRAMANPEWRKANTSISSGFIEGYYKNSRLHHLATWKAEHKNLVQIAQERAESAFQASQVSAESTSGDKISMRGAELVMRSPNVKSKRKGKAKAIDDDERVIMHCDFDCFFVSAGLVSRPELKGKPVVVCHSQGGQGGSSSTSEIASSSYAARKFGIKNGMRWVTFVQVRIQC